MNIDEISVDMEFIGVKNKNSDERYVDSTVKVTNKTSNSIEVYFKAKSVDGADGWQWFTIDAFTKTFVVK